MIAPEGIGGIHRKLRRSGLISRGRLLDSALMKLVRWRRFTWDLTKLPAQLSPLPPQYNIHTASRDDVKGTCNVIFSAFSQDTSWSDTFITFRDRLEQQLEATFGRETVPAVVVTHGQRIIAASALNTEVDAESHLLTGPCVLVEYHNRGIGTALLQASLKQLQSAGLSRANGICKETAPTSKFVYPKFGSTQAAYDFEPSVVLR